MENFNLKLYMAEIDSVKKYLHSSSDLSKHLNELDNYLEQVKCVNKSRLFLHLDESDAIFDFENKFSSLCKVNKEETKQKLLFKITSLINESIHSTKIIIDSIDSHLNEMSRQADLVKMKISGESDNEDELNIENLYESMCEINKQFWLNYYSLKEEFKYENLIKHYSTSKIKSCIETWLQVTLLRLQKKDLIMSLGELGNLKLDKKAQDVANNNHIEYFLDQKLKKVSLNNKSDYNLFDSRLYTSIKTNEFKFQYDKFELKHVDSSEYWFDLGSNLIMRPLQRDDFNKNYMQLLSQLTEIGDVNQADFEKRFDLMKSSLNTYYINVVEDLTQKKIVASLTLVYEQKFIRNTSARGRIEDVVVDKDYRGKQLSKMLLDLSCQLSHLLGCYKLSLECKDPLKKLYEQFDFSSEKGQNYLCRRFVAKI